MRDTAHAISILHLLAPARFGGLETVVTSLTPALAAIGTRVTVALVVTPDDADQTHPVARALEGTGVGVETMVVAVRDYLGERRRVRELIERHSVDVLHTHGYRPDVVDAPVARRMGIPTVSTAHGHTGFMGGGLKGKVYEWLQARAWRRFDAVIAVSSALASSLGADGVSAERIHLLPNAWMPSMAWKDRDRARAELDLPPHVPVVGWVGRMGREKAPDIMIRAAAEVRATDVVFSMIGDGPERASAQGLVSELAIDDRVRWHGSIAHAGSLMKALDALVLTSWTEGTPMVLLEAMAAGVPIVSTAVGGVPAVVSSDEARLCEPGAVEEIARAIDRVLSDPEEAHRMAAAAKQRLETDFAVDPWARRHLEIYESLLRT